MNKINWSVVKNSEVSGVKVKDFLHNKGLDVPHSSRLVTDFDKVKLAYLLNTDFGGMLQVQGDIDYKYSVDLYTHLTQVLGKLQDRLEGKPKFEVRLVLEDSRTYNKVQIEKEQLTIDNVKYFRGYDIALGGYLGLGDYVYYFETEFMDFVDSREWFYKFKNILLVDFLEGMSCDLDGLLFDGGYSDNEAVGDKVYLLDEEINKLLRELDEVIR